VFARVTCIARQAGAHAKQTMRLMIDNHKGRKPDTTATDLVVLSSQLSHMQWWSQTWASELSPQNVT